MRSKTNTRSVIIAVCCLLAIMLIACGSPANTANVVTERPAGPADKVELVMFHFTSR